MDKPAIEIRARLREAIDIRNVTQQELSSKTGIPKSSISQYLSGYAKPKSDRIYLIASALDVNEAWLLGYDVPMSSSCPEPPAPAESTVSLSASESELVDKFRQLNDDGQEKLLDYAEDLAGLPRYKKDNLFEALEEEA